MNQYLNYLYYILTVIVLLYGFFKIKDFISKYKLGKSLAEAEKIKNTIDNSEKELVDTIKNKKENIKKIKEKIKEIEKSKDGVVNEKKSIETDIKKISKKLKNL